MPILFIFIKVMLNIKRVIFWVFVLCIVYASISVTFAYTLTKSENTKVHLIANKLVSIIGTDSIKQKVFLAKMDTFKKKYSHNERMLAIIEKLTSATVWKNTSLSYSGSKGSHDASTNIQTLHEDKKLAFALLSLANKDNISQVDALLSNSSIDGIAVQIGWTGMETADEVYDWTTLDTLIKKVKQKWKGLTLHVFSWVGWALPFPLWLKNAGVKTYTLTDFQGRKREEALPWDETFLSQYSQFLKSLSAHLSDSDSLDTIKRISVSVPVAEMDLVACRENKLAGTYEYDRATYLSAWKMMIDAYAASFPSVKKLISAPVGVICFPEHDTQFFVDIMDYATVHYGTTFIPFAADLTAEGSDRMKPYIDQFSKGGLWYQPIWSSTEDPSTRMKGTYPWSLLKATCEAISDKADYIEIYAVDVSNTDTTIQKWIKAIHDPTLCE